MTKRALALLAAVCLLLTGHAFAGVIPSGETDVFGEAFSTSAIQQPVNMIFMWATWCGNCAGEVKDINALAKEYKGKMGVAAVTMDAATEQGRDENAISAAQQIMKSARFQSVVPSQKLLTTLRDAGVQAMPTVWFTDKDGKLLYTVTGVLQYDDWRAIIDSLLPQ